MQKWSDGVFSEPFSGSADSAWYGLAVECMGSVSNTKFMVSRTSLSYVLYVHTKILSLPIRLKASEPL
jgi:hypothetical protein